MKLRLATRKSKLALAQARAYAEGLLALAPAGSSIEEVHIVTSGDRFQDRPLQELGGKGLFIKEIEEALLRGDADFAVHSVKDVPAELAPGLVLAAVPPRADARDALVTRDGRRLGELAPGARIGTSSLRRRVFIARARPDLEVVTLRGNVDTRLRKLDEGELDAIVLAAAGLERLGLAARATELCAPEVCLPAVGQGALGIECRAGDAEVLALLARSECATTRVCVAAERAVMRALGGSCHLPIAAYGLKDGDELHLRAMLAAPDGSDVREAADRTAFPANADAAAAFGEALAQRLS